MERQNPESRLLDSRSGPLITQGGKLYRCGVCRICGCTDANPCRDELVDLTCCWIDADHTLCDNLQCIAAVPLGDLELMIAAEEAK